MIYRATRPQNLSEGRPSVSMPVRGPPFNIPEMPPQFKLDPSMVKSRRAILEQPNTYDQSHMHPLMSMRKDRSHVHHGVHQVGGGGASNLQPFTAPWLTEVARMTPIRPLDPHLQFHSSPDYFPHIHAGLGSRTPMYNPPFLQPQSYLRDYVHPPRHHYKNNLHPSDLIREPQPLPTSIGATTLVSTSHPQPMSSRVALPARINHDVEVPLDFRDRRSPTQSYLPVPAQSAPTESDEPSPKRRLIRFSEPRSPSSAANISKSVSSHSEWSHSHISSPILTRTEPPATSKSVRSNEPAIRPESPFHPHFKKGSFVSLPNGVQKVEDMQTKDFIVATEMSSTLKLDPSKVEGIERTKEESVSEITFSFASTNTKIAVKTSNCHPFFVFHRGWSSCDPKKTEDKYGLKTYQLCCGDVCISLKKIESAEDTKTSMPPPKVPAKSSSVSASKSDPVPTTSAPASSDNSEASVSREDKRDLTFQPNFPLSATRPGVRSSADLPTKHIRRGRKRRWSDPGH